LLENELNKGYISNYKTTIARAWFIESQGQDGREDTVGITGQYIAYQDYIIQQNIRRLAAGIKLPCTFV
jgi:hypothetical protein